MGKLKTWLAIIKNNPIHQHGLTIILKTIFISCFLILLPTTLGITTDIKNFPADISESIHSSNEINTPEYVIIRSSDEITFSSETAASVAVLNVKEGSHFEKGDVLLELDCRVQKADLKKSQAQQQTTDIALKSAIKLKSYDSISEYELVKARSEANMVRADVDKLQAIVDKCTIRAPFNGAVSSLLVHAYESVKPGDPLLKIVNTENLVFELQVPSQWLQWLHVGTIFYVHLNEINKTIKASVTKINPQIESVSQMVKIFGSIMQPDPALLPGMSGQVSFPDNPVNKTVKKRKP